MSFVNNISDSATIRFLGLGQYFVQTLYAYVHNVRVKIYNIKLNEAKVKTIRYE